MLVPDLGDADISCKPLFFGRLDGIRLVPYIVSCQHPGAGVKVRAKDKPVTSLESRYGYGWVANNPKREIFIMRNTKIGGGGQPFPWIGGGGQYDIGGGGIPPIFIVRGGGGQSD